MSKRILVSLVLPAVAALAITACGGGGSSAEEKIAETIEKVTTTNDPSTCTRLETQRFVEQDSDKKGAGAVKTCEKEAKEGENKAEVANVSSVSVNGSKATAEVEFEGGGLDAQTLEVSLVEAGGTWKLDHVDGFAKYDGAALGKAFEEEFEEHPRGLSKEQASCIAGRIAKASQPEAEALLLSGSSRPIVELAKGCA